MAASVSSFTRTFCWSLSHGSSDADAWVGKLYADQWTAVHLSLPQLLDAALADLEAWGLPLFRPS
jgi:hypothetical protein